MLLVNGSFRGDICFQYPLPGSLDFPFQQALIAALIRTAKAKARNITNHHNDAGENNRGRLGTRHGRPGKCARMISDRKKEISMEQKSKERERRSSPLARLLPGKKFDRT